MPDVKTGGMDEPLVPRRWSWTTFVVGLVLGIPLGGVGLIVLLQMIAVMIS